MEWLAMNRKKAIKIIITALSVIAVLIIVFLAREKYLCRAEYHGDTVEFDGMVYKETDYKKISPYKETWRIICKTTDGVWTVYEIAEYPGREYAVIRSAWEARVLERKNN